MSKHKFDDEFRKQIVDLAERKINSNTFQEQRAMNNVRKNTHSL